MRPRPHPIPASRGIVTPFRGVDKAVHPLIFGNLFPKRFPAKRIPVRVRTTRQIKNLELVPIPSERTLALAGDGDVFAAAIARTFLAAGTRNRAGDLVGIDAAIGAGGCKFARLAVGAGGVRAAFFALGEALVDAVAVGLVGDDENPAVGPCGGRGEQGHTGQKGCRKSHAAPMK